MDGHTRLLAVPDVVAGADSLLVHDAYRIFRHLVSDSVCFAGACAGMDGSNMGTHGNDCSWCVCYAATDHVFDGGLCYRNALCPRKITSPLGQLADITHKIGSGNFQTALPPRPWG